MLGWIKGHEEWLLWLTIASGVMLVASVLVIPWLVTRLPADYFADDEHPAPWANHHPILRALLLVLKNLFGVILVVLGALMLVLPGQGLLTIVAGLALIDFPGRHRLVQWIVAREPVLRALNWMRRKSGQPEFAMDARKA